MGLANCYGEHVVPLARGAVFELGCAPDVGVAKWQNRFEAVWKRLAGGCTDPSGRTNDRPGAVCSDPAGCPLRAHDAALGRSDRMGRGGEDCLNLRLSALRPLA